MDKKRLVQLIERVTEENKKEFVDFLSEFLQINNENPPGLNYEEAVDFIQEKMMNLGCEVEKFNVSDEELKELAPEVADYPRFFSVATYRGTQDRPRIHFSGHYDVVPAGGAWTQDPYGGKVEDGKIYGRGASDMKSGIAAQICALEVIQKSGLKLKGSYTSSVVPDEETGGKAGMGYLVKKGYLNKENTDYAVITEPLDVDKICLGHRGTYWFALTVFGIQSHGSMPSEGFNPIEGMMEILRQIDEKIRPKLEVETTYPVHPIKSRKTTLSVTQINAGTKVNTIPDSCTATFDWRLIPEQRVEWAKELLVDICEDLKRKELILDYEIKPIVEVNPTVVSEDQDLVYAFKEAGKAILGKEMGYTFSPGYHDQRFIVNEGHLEDTIVYGPGQLTQAHKSDEHITIEDYLNGIKIMALATILLLGVEEN